MYVGWTAAGNSAASLWPSPPSYIEEGVGTAPNNSLHRTPTTLRAVVAGKLLAFGDPTAKPMTQRQASLARRHPRKSESRHARIDALLDYAEAQMEDIAQSYESQLRSAHVPLELAIKIKNCCENMRSALDYLAHHIFKLNYPGTQVPETLNFPLGWTRKKADTAINKQFPNLRNVNRPLWRALHAAQPYKRGNKWLRRFVTVVNDHKHWDLVGQRVRKVNVDSPRARGFGPFVFLLEPENVLIEYRFRGIEANAFFLLGQATRISDCSHLSFHMRSDRSPNSRFHRTAGFAARTVKRQSVGGELEP